MKFFGWVQNKLNGKQGSSSKSHTVSTTDHMKQEPRQEFSDWPHGLLAIGTFGNSNEITEIPRSQNVPRQDRPFDNIPEDEHEPCSSEDLHEFTPEEVGKLEKELTKLLSRKPDVKKELANLPLDRWLNCPSSLEVDRRISNALCSDSGDKADQQDIDRTISVILGRCKDICAANKKKSIGKKSVSFLLKKMFACSSGFSPAPSLRDTLQESKMEKLLRVMLHKKIYNQNPSRTSAMKKYLEDKQTTARRQNNEDETQEIRKSEDGCKWVKTDSEYIVLEI